MEQTMSSLNKLILIGNLGADPEVRFPASGVSMTILNVATTDRRSDGKDGYVLLTNWHRVVVFGKQAEVARRCLKKGSQVYVEGKLESRTWTDPAGVLHKSWTVVADRVLMLGKPPEVHPDGGAREEAAVAWLDTPPIGGGTDGHGNPSPGTGNSEALPI
jgi:single-strand DNA-binding protein